MLVLCCRWMVAWREVRNFKDGNKFKYRLCDGQAMGPVSNSSTRYGIIFISPVIELVIVTYTINKSIHETAQTPFLG